MLPLCYATSAPVMRVRRGYLFALQRCRCFLVCYMPLAIIGFRRYRSAVCGCPWDFDLVWIVGATLRSSDRTTYRLPLGLAVTMMQGYLFWIVGLRLLAPAVPQYAQIAELVASDAASDFGWSVAIDGDTVVIGVPGNETAPATPGSVYIFRTDDGGATFAQVTKLTAVAAHGQFGIAVAIDGDTVVVGSPYDDPGGSAYVFRTTDGATYGLVAKLTANDTAANDLFGWSVAIKQGTIVVGAYGKDREVWDDMANLITHADMGLVYLYQTSDDGATWSPGNRPDTISYGSTDYLNQLGLVPASLPPGCNPYCNTDYAAGDAFGYSVAIFEYADTSGNLIHDPDLGPVYSTTEFTQNVIVVGGFSEAAYIYSGHSYSETILTADDSVDGDRFGWSVAIDGNTVVVGAPWHDNESGSAYVFLTYFGGSKKKGKKSMDMPPGPLREFVEFAGRDELKGDYYFANRAQRLHAEERSKHADARGLDVSPRIPRPGGRHFGRPRQRPPQQPAAVDVAGRDGEYHPEGRPRSAPRLRAPAVPRDDAVGPRGAPRPHALQPPTVRRRAPREAPGLRSPRLFGCFFSS